MLRCLPTSAQVNVVTNVTVTGVDISQLLSQALAPNATGASLTNPLQQQIKVDPAQSVNITPTGVTGQNQVCPLLACMIVLWYSQQYGVSALRMVSNQGQPVAYLLAGMLWKQVRAADSQASFQLACNGTPRSGIIEDISVQIAASASMSEGQSHREIQKIPLAKCVPNHHRMSQWSTRAVLGRHLSKTWCIEARSGELKSDGSSYSANNLEASAR